MPSIQSALMILFYYFLFFIASSILRMSIGFMFVSACWTVYWLVQLSYYVLYPAHSSTINHQFVFSIVIHLSSGDWSLPYPGINSHLAYLHSDLCFPYRHWTGCICASTSYAWLEGYLDNGSSEHVSLTPCKSLHHYAPIIGLLDIHHCTCLHERKLPLLGWESQCWT